MLDRRFKKIHQLSAENADIQYLLKIYLQPQKILPAEPFTSNDHRHLLMRHFYSVVLESDRNNLPRVKNIVRKSLRILYVNSLPSKHNTLHNLSQVSSSQYYYMEIKTPYSFE